MGEGNGITGETHQTAQKHGRKAKEDPVTVAELMAYLSTMSDDAPVLVAVQPNYPMEFSLKVVDQRVS